MNKSNIEIESTSEFVTKPRLGVVLPNGKEWMNFVISPSILEDKRTATAYEAGFKDCLIEIKKRIYEFEKNNP